MTPDNRTIHASTVLERIPAEKLRQIDRAIVLRDPPAYTAVFKKFEIESHNVSFSAFWRYAHRMRARAESANLVELVSSDDLQATQLLPTLMAQRVRAA